MFGIWLGKLTTLILRWSGRRATSLPGKVALKASPRLLEKLGRKLKRVIVVTGTNGKTTTAGLLGTMLRAEGDIVHNGEGANMYQGLVTSLVQSTSWFGRMKSDVALLEIDEATLPLVANKLPIQLVVITNVFRDQLDRYGELDTTIQKLMDGISETKATLILNADDPLARHIGLKLGGHPAIYYGLRKKLATSARAQMRDGAFCLECGHVLEYEGFYYGQLGIYRCPNCDFERPHPQFIGDVTLEGISVQQNELPRVEFPLPVRGIFNAYNALAAITTARVYGITASGIAAGLTSFKAPLGRMQAFRTTPQTILNLIKNPTGCDSVLGAITSEPGDKLICIAINDFAADGRDVSWLWDADFELLAEDNRMVHCVTSGTRAEDMAVRMKYAGMPIDRITVIPDLSSAIERTLGLGQELGIPVHVVTTYTALYPASVILERRTVQHEDTSNRASLS